MQGVGGFGGKGGGGGVRETRSVAASNFALLVGCETWVGHLRLIHTAFFYERLLGWGAGVFVPLLVSAFFRVIFRV